MPTVAAPMLTQPLHDLAGWTDWFAQADIPVLADTADTLAVLRTNEDAVDANSLGQLIAADPLMTLKVLVYAATHRPSRLVTDTETVTAALVMMGISPFFRDFDALESAEQRLASHPDALHGLQDVLRRAHRSANFALAFAVHRMDDDAAVIHNAALLHDFADMLLWCHAPELAQRIREQLQADSTLRSSAVQRRELGIELPDLQQALMKRWRLPELLVRISDDRHADQAAVRNVLLAVRLARHTALGWDNPALPDDLAEISALLNLSPGATLQLVHDVDR